MAHEISINSNGQAEAFFARKPAWHGLGTVLDHAPNSAEAIVAAHLDWDVVKQPLFTAMDSFGMVGLKGVDNWFANVRSDTNEVLGVVSDKYKIVQNREAFSFLDSLCQDGLIQYESAGALRGGKTVWLLARMPSVDEIAPGDVTQRYILFSTSHDGSQAIHAIPTSVRVVCANTLRVATATDTGFSHTGNVARKMEVARRYLSQFDEKFTLFRDNARLLVDAKVTGSAAEEYLKTLFPEIDSLEKKRQVTLRQRRIDQIRSNLSSPTNTIGGIKGTWWALFNAVTEQTDHQGKTVKDLAQQESRMLSALDGSAADFKAKAFELALTMSS